MKIPIYQVDAFTGRLFHGNPAAVCPLQEWLPDSLMQKIAMENNLSETAFFVPQGDRFAIRWLTPALEVDLCGHATLATAYVVFRFLRPGTDTIEFHSRSGVLGVTRQGDLLTLDFPADVVARTPPREDLAHALGGWPLEFLKGRTDYFLVYGSQQDIESMTPDFTALAQVAARGIIVTARGNEVDFVSRFFAPQSGVPEDPVTGSAHTSLTPYWAARLAKSDLSAIQLSARRGWLKCSLAGDRVRISGQARLYLTGEIETA
jgi:PhzF family phenazine biosynthesis protein